MNFQSYKGKYFSVLGDSISTLAGYNPPDCAVFYEYFEMRETGVYDFSDTWWGRVINSLGGRLLVNHSVSGSTVAKLDIYDLPSYGCSEERANALKNEKSAPDVIMIYMGINDWGFGIKPRAVSSDEANEIRIVSVAYKQLLSNLRKIYPKSEIWCLTIPRGFRRGDESDLAPLV